MHILFFMKKKRKRKRKAQQPSIFVYNQRRKRTYRIVFLLFVFLSPTKKKALKIEQYKVRDE